MREACCCIASSPVRTGLGTDNSRTWTSSSAYCHAGF